MKGLVYSNGLQYTRDRLAVCIGFDPDLFVDQALDRLDVGEGFHFWRFRGRGVGGLLFVLAFFAYWGWGW